MNGSANGASPLGEAAKRFVRRLPVLGENRIELLRIELQQTVACLLRLFVLALAVGVFGLLAGLTLTAAVAVCFWRLSALAALLVLGGLHGTIAALLWRRLWRLRREWKTLPATLDQLRKDFSCLKELLH